MKKKLSLSALLIFAAAGLCAAVPVKPVKGNDPTIKSMIKFAQLPTKRGIEIKLAPDAPGKAVVLIYNWNNDVVWKDALSPKKGMDRAFILSMLDNGNYTVEVMLNKQIVEKTAHVYYKGDTKFVTLRG